MCMQEMILEADLQLLCIKTTNSICTLLLVLYWTGTWWSGVNDEKVKEGKRLIFPGLRSQPSSSRESARKREREKDRHGDPGSDGAKVF